MSIRDKAYSDMYQALKGIVEAFGSGSNGMKETKQAIYALAFADMVEICESSCNPVKRIPSWPELRDGEHYAGIILGKDGEPGYHLILLPGEAIDINWQSAMELAEKQGGELPTNREQSLLSANLNEQFQPRWYWSSEEYSDNARVALVRHFGNGFNDNCLKISEGCSRAVRRVPIQKGD